MQNRSVPTSSPIPHVVYAEVDVAIDLLCQKLGFVELYRYGNRDKPSGAQLKFADAIVMIEASRPGRVTPAQANGLTQYTTLFVADVEEHFHRCALSGCRIVEDLNDTIYGERQFVVEDYAGHRWIFSQHVKDVEPSDWGALTSESPNR
jgi:uncharacterized glyoxalase superfamily protein PhnB